MCWRSANRHTPAAERDACSADGHGSPGNGHASAANTHFAAFMQKNIFDPLGMKNSGFGPTAPGMAIGHRNRRGEPVAVDRTAYADRGLYSTVEDLYLWDQALYTDKLLPKALLDLLFKAQVKLPATDYGYGWAIGQKGGQMMIWHDGWSEGYNSYILRLPASRLVIVTLANAAGRSLPAKGLGDMLADVLLKGN